MNTSSLVLEGWQTLTRTVLVVDDDEGLQESLCMLMESEGYNVAVARDGLDALEKLQSVRPAIILLDVMMPRMDGLQFAQEVRERALLPGVPIVLLSANGHVRDDAARVGAQAWLPKPFGILELIETVERLLQASPESDVPNQFFHESAPHAS